MTRKEILKKAEECVCGHREADYGSPEDNFEKIANLWNVYLGLTNPHIKPKDVAIMMALLKIARISTGHGTDDSYIDLAGYAACGGELSKETKYAYGLGMIKYEPVNIDRNFFVGCGNKPDEDPIEIDLSAFAKNTSPIMEGGR